MSVTNLLRIQYFSALTVQGRRAFWISGMRATSAGTRREAQARRASARGLTVEVQGTRRRFLLESRYRHSATRTMEEMRPTKEELANVVAKDPARKGK